MKNLTQKQLVFVIEYLETGNRVEAYRRAYDCDRMAKATISRKAQEVAVIPHVAAEIAKQQEALLVRHHDLEDEIIRALKEFAFVDITDFVWYDGKSAWIKDANLLTLQERARIKRLHVTKGGFCVVLHDTLRALELLGRHLGMFNGANQPQATTLFLNIMPVNGE